MCTAPTVSDDHSAGPKTKQLQKQLAALLCQKHLESHLLRHKGAQRAERGVQCPRFPCQGALVVPQQVCCALHLVRRADLQQTL